MTRLFVNKGLLALFLVCLSMSALTGFELINVLATPAPSISTTVTPGTLQIDCRFVVYKDGTTTLAKDITGDNIYSSSAGATSEVVIQNAINALTPGRNYYQKVCLEGYFTIDLQLVTTLRIGILLPSYTMLQIDGTVKLKDASTTVAGATNFIISTSTLSSSNVIVFGGEVDGNKVNQSVGCGVNAIYGIEFNNSHDVWTQNVFVHDTCETAIAFEGSSSTTCYNGWAISNHVKTTDEDGIGNQFNCKNISYFDNYVEGARNPGSGIFVEGGHEILVQGNVLFNNTNGIKVTRGTLTAVEGVIIDGNTSLNNTVDGIQLLNAVIDVIVSNNQVATNQGNGILIGTGAGGIAGNITVTGNIIRDNDKAQAGNQGIFVQNPANWLMITGNNCFDDQPVHTQDYGIYLQAGVTRIAVVGNACVGNQQGGIRDLGTNDQIHSSWNNTTWIT